MLEQISKGHPCHSMHYCTTFTSELRPSSGKKTAEYERVKTSRSSITGALQSNPSASQTLRQKFKEKGWLESSSNPEDDQLVTLILSRIKHDIHQFEEFIAVLKDIDGMDLIVDILTSMTITQLYSSTSNYLIAWRECKEGASGEKYKGRR